MIKNGETCLVTAVEKLLYGISEKAMSSGVKTAREIFSINQNEICHSPKKMRASK